MTYESLKNLTDPESEAHPDYSTQTLIFYAEILNSWCKNKLKTPDTHYTYRDFDDRKNAAGDKKLIVMEPDGALYSMICWTSSRGRYQIYLYGRSLDSILDRADGSNIIEIPLDEHTHHGLATICVCMYAKSVALNYFNDFRKDDAEVKYYRYLWSYELCRARVVENEPNWVQKTKNKPLTVAQKRELAKDEYHSDDVLTVGALVFAKLKGSSDWPAIIFERDGNICNVRFLVDDNTAKLHKKHLHIYNEMSARLLVHDHFGKQKKSKTLRTAVNMAERIYRDTQQNTSVREFSIDGPAASSSFL